MFLTSLIACGLFSLSAQTYPEDWFGEALDPVWFDITQTPAFPDAPAVVIQEECRVHFELFGRAPRVRYEYLRRIRIQEDGVPTVLSVSLVSSGERESMADWKAATYSLNAEGELLAFPVDRRTVQIDKLPGEQRYSFPFPFVRKGAILELRYQVYSENIKSLNTWVFQQSWPVLRSQITTFIPASYQYLEIARGDLRGLIRLEGEFQQRETNLSLTDDQTASRLASGGAWRNSSQFFGSAMTYRMINLPPVLKGEAFAPDQASDYLPSIGWQLEEDLFQRANNENLYTSWTHMDKVLSRRFRTGKLPAGDRDALAALVARRKKGSASATLDALYQEFRRWEWNGEYEAVPGSLGRAWKERSGSSAEINSLFLLALREAGLTASPVLISRKEHGFVQAVYPLITQFDHLLVAVDLGGDPVLVDVVGGMEKPGLLPRSDLNGEGFVVNGDGGEWIPLQSYQKINQVTYSRLVVHPEEMALVGEVAVVSQDYSLEIEEGRLEAAGNDPASYFSTWVLEEGDHLDWSNGKIERREHLGEELSISCGVKMEDYLVRSDDLIFIKPMLMRSLARNPFQSPDRTAPIDLTYPVWEAHMLGLEIPAGYEIAQLPASIRVIMPGNAGQFMYNVMDLGNILHITSSIQINRTRFSAEEYQAIRQFFEYVVNKHQEDIVIKKVAN